MNAPRPDPRLKVPVDPAVIIDTALKVLLALPEMVKTLVDAIDDLTDTVGVLSLYAERKGKTEGLITETDIPEVKDGTGNPKS